MMELHYQDNFGKLYRGECLEVMRSFGDESIDLIVSSPPYFNLKEYSSWQTYEDYLVDVLSWFREMYRILKIGRHICWNIQDNIPEPRDGGSHYYALMPDTVKIAQKVGLEWERNVIWNKQNATQIYFGCLSGESRIKLMDGSYKDIKDISVGDMVWTLRDGKMAQGKVTNFFNKGQMPVSTVKTRHQEIKATADHRFFVLSPEPSGPIKWYAYKSTKKNFNLNWKRLDELTTQDSLLCPDILYGSDGAGRILLNTTINQNTPIVKKYLPTRLLGFFLGDGWCVHSRGKLQKSIQFEIHNKRIALFYKRLIKKNLGWSWFLTNKLPSTGGGTFVLTSRILSKWLANNGFDKKARFKRIPRIIYGLSTEERKEFVSGFIDADGSICKRTGGIVLCSSSKGLLLDFKELLLTIGMQSSNLVKRRPRVSRINGKNIRSGEGYTLKISLSQYLGLGITSLKLKNIDLKKRLGVNSINFGNVKYYPQRITDISATGVENVYDISIGNSDNFVANGVIVHNSFPFPPNIMYSPVTESVCIFRKRGKTDLGKKSDKSIIPTKLWNSWKNSLWTFAPETNSEHPAPFPEELPRRCITNHSFVDDTVLDPFGGSATTGVVAKLLHRNYILIERNEQYCLASARRLEGTHYQVPLF